MSETITIAGGPPANNLTIVTADQVTIGGDGTSERPLHAISGSNPSVNVENQGAVIGGNPHGTLNFTGDGVTASDAGGGVAAISIPGGTFRAQFHQTSSPPSIGMPVFVSAFPPDVGFQARVAKASIDPVPIPPGKPDVGFNLELSSAVGLIQSVNGDGTVQVQTGNFMTLTTAQWDTLTGGSGGLLPGNVYYVAFSTQDSNLLRGTMIDQAGFMSARIGMAASATTMLISPQEPVQILGESIAFPSDTGSAGIGMAVYETVTPGRFDAAIATNATQAQVIGIVTNVTGSPVVQFQGIVTLTAAQWTAVTGDIGGLQTGDAYWLSAATPGNLTKTKPIASGTFAVQIGTAISTTQLVMNGILPQENP